MPDDTRHSRALESQIVTDPEDLARLEAYNTLRQYLKLEEMIGYFPDLIIRSSCGHRTS